MLGTSAAQEKVDAKAKVLQQSDTKAQIAGALWLATGLLPRPFKILSTPLAFFAVFEAGKRYHDYREYKKTLSEANATTTFGSIKDKYPGFFHPPEKSQVLNAGGAIQNDLVEAYEMGEEAWDKIKKLIG